MKRIVKSYQEGRFFYSINRKIRHLFHLLKYAIYNPALGSVSLHCPEYVNPKQDELEIVKRIFCSFRKMKKDQLSAPKCYLPSSLWQKHLNETYSCLVSGLEENDINKFHFFLSNFGTWKEYLGIESSTLIRDNMSFFLKRRFLENDVFYNQLKTWKWFYNNTKPASLLSYPTYGNQAGAYIDGMFVGCGSFFNEINGSLLNGLISDKGRPIVAELGAGYGKLAYFILRDIKNFVFIDFDLPEILCLAAYYLMKVFPDKKVLLYGEEGYSIEAHEKYDLIFMPSFEISKVKERSIDLFINKNSLGEMTKEAAINYVNYVSKVTKGYFFHMNHELYPNVYNNNEKGLLGYEYPIPLNEFTLLFRYPDIGHMLYQGFLDFNADIFMYLYERKNNI